MPALRDVELGHHAIVDAGREVPLDALAFLVARSLSVQRETAELAAMINAPRVELQRRVAYLCRHNLLDTPRAREQATLVRRVALWPGYDVEATQWGRLCGETVVGVELAEGLDGVVAALVQPLREALDATAARFRESELFATRAAFAVPESDPEDQTRRFLATLTRVKNALCAREPEQAVRIASFFSGDGPSLAVEQARAGAMAALDAGVRGVTGLAHTALEILLGLRADDLEPELEADLTAAFFCDVTTLVRGDPPRPLPLWF